MTNSGAGRAASDESDAPGGREEGGNLDRFSTQLADFVVGMRHADLSQQLRSRLTDALLDCFGVAVAGSAEPATRAVRMILPTVANVAEGAWLFGSTRWVSPSDAALHNGTAAHALDFDDVTHPANAHITCSILAALLAVLPDVHPLDDRFLRSYLAGFEVAAKLGTIVDRPFRRGPWHPTGVFGTVGAASAVASALELSADETRNAIGIAASCAAGIMGNFGSMTKPLHSGRAAQAGVQAGLLARSGFTSSPRSMAGFLETFSNLIPVEQIARVEQAVERLGAPWEITTDEGLALKPYPSCAETLAPIEAAVDIALEVDYRDIADVYVGCATSAIPVLISHPANGLEAKFSMEFCVALALKRGAPKIEDFTSENLADSDLESVMRLVRVGVDDDPAIRDNHDYGCLVAVTTKSGDRIERRVLVPKGRSTRWMSRADSREKFVTAVATVIGEQSAAELYGALTSPAAATMADVRTLATSNIRP